MDMYRSLGLAAKAVVANEPFFGRGESVMKATRREQDLKYEIVAPIASEDHLTAITSSNYHVDHFGKAFYIRFADVKVAHTSCVGLGCERIAFALFEAHGRNPERWPTEARGRLQL